MKVFVLFTQQVIDFDNDEGVSLFATKEKAKAAFDEFVREEKRNAEDDGWKVELDEMEFCAYEDERYSENRVVAFIIEQEVEEEKRSEWEAICEIKKGLIAKIVELVGERTIDVSDDDISVSAVEHNCGEGYRDRLISISADGFASSDGCGYAPWRDMVVEDLAMVHDYLTTGEW